MKPIGSQTRATRNQQYKNNLNFRGILEEFSKKDLKRDIEKTYLIQHDEDNYNYCKILYISKLRRQF